MQGQRTIHQAVCHGVAGFIGPVYALGTGDAGPSVIAEIDVFLEDAVDGGYGGVVAGPVEDLLVGNKDLSAVRNDQQVRFDVTEAGPDQGVESIVDGQDDDQGGRADGHADGADRGDDVDHIV